MLNRLLSRLYFSRPVVIWSFVLFAFISILSHMNCGRGLKFNEVPSDSVGQPSDGVPLPKKYVFATSAKYCGNMSAAVNCAAPGVRGRGAADAYCQTAALNSDNPEIVQLSNSFVSWLSLTGGVNADAISRINEGRFVTPDDVEVFSSREALKVGPLTKITDEDGNALTGETFWTGTNQSGIYQNSNCFNWDPPVITEIGLTGTDLWTTALIHQWTNVGPFTCNSQRHIICFQQ